MNSRKIKKAVQTILAEKGYPDFLGDILCYPLKKVIGALFSCLNSNNEKIKWHAISCFGEVLREITDKEPDYGRTFIRRLIWMLCDESGGIGWGVPEVMGEVLSQVEFLATEFSTILIYQIIDLPGRADLFLEHEPLRRGGYFAVARFSQKYPHEVKKYLNNIVESFEKETDLYIQLMGLLLFKTIGFSWPGAKDLAHRKERLTVYWEHKFQEFVLGDIAKKLL